MVTLLKHEFRAEASFDEGLARHPRFPRLIALKIDVQRRGVHYTPRAVAAIDPAVDFVVRGEGEEVFARLLEALEGRWALAEVPGHCYRLEGGLRIAERAPPGVCFVEPWKWPTNCEP